MTPATLVRATSHASGVPRDSQVRELRAPLWDGTENFYRCWLPAGVATKAVLLFHRGHEHSGRWSEIVERLGLHDTAIFAWDQRGHGRSPGERGYADSFAALEKDVDCFVRFISQEHRIPI